MYNLLKFIKSVIPFLSVIILWRLTHNFWNPGGILAIIPIFYCSFVKPVKYFNWFALIFCFLIDYNFDTKLFWTCVYCVLYAINEFQTFTDLSRLDKNAINAFMVVFGFSLFLITIFHINWTVLIRVIWIFVLCTLLYIPITNCIKRLSK